VGGVTDLSLTRTANDRYALGMRALRADITTLQAAITTLTARAAAPVGGRAGRVKGYPSVAERHAKLQRRDVLATRLDQAQARLDAGRPSIVVGGKRLLKTRANLDAAGLTPDQWRDRWDAARMFLTADGESGKR
jgi:hypothetical protein